MKVACVVAAGNSGGPVQYPAASPNVLAVGELYEREHRVSYAMHLAQHGSVRHFPTHLRGTYGTLEEVEVAAVSVTGTERMMSVGSAE